MVRHSQGNRWWKFLLDYNIIILQYDGHSDVFTLHKSPPYKAWWSVTVAGWPKIDGCKWSSDYYRATVYRSMYRLFLALVIWPGLAELIEARFSCANWKKFCLCWCVVDSDWVVVINVMTHVAHLSALSAKECQVCLCTMPTHMYAYGHTCSWAYCTCTHSCHVSNNMVRVLYMHVCQCDLTPSPPRPVVCLCCQWQL